MGYVNNAYNPATIIRGQKHRIKELQELFVDMYNCWHAGTQVPDRLHDAYRQELIALESNIYPKETV